MKPASFELTWKKRRECFECGLSLVNIQRCLFAEDYFLTFKKAVGKALSFEEAIKNPSVCHIPDNLNEKSGSLIVTAAN